MYLFFYKFKDLKIKKHPDNVPIRVILLLIDEIFDIREKNQWLRQSLMALIKTLIKNLKGDSMNK